MGESQYFARKAAIAVEIDAVVVVTSFTVSCFLIVIYGFPTDHVSEISIQRRENWVQFITSCKAKGNQFLLVA